MMLKDGGKHVIMSHEGKYVQQVLTLGKSAECVNFPPISDLAYVSMIP